MLNIPAKISRNIFYLSLTAIAIALPLSLFLLSLAQIVLLINWLIEEKLSDRWKKIKQTPAVWFIALFYLIHLAGLLWTTDFNYGSHDIKIKLPFLVIPVIIGTTEPVNKLWLKRILQFYIAGVVISSLYSTYIVVNLHGNLISQLKTVSPFVSHIRLSLMVTGALFIQGWLIFQTEKKWLKLLYIITGIWLFAFLFILQAFTGIIILAITSVILIVYWAFKTRQLMIQWFILILVLTFILLTATYTVHFYTRYFSPLPIDTSKLDKYTLNGNAYWSDPKAVNIENGNYIYLYICDKELRKEWNRISKIKFDSTTSNGSEIKYTIYRYLTAKGLRKDSAGLARLTPDDIRNIENNIANPIYLQKFGLHARIYLMMWELYHYYHGSNPTGFSVAQRIEYLKTAFGIIHRHFWLGTGTGDVVNEFQKQYELDKSPLAMEWRLRAHNQLVTFWLTFGLIGFLGIVASIFVPPFILHKYKNYLFMSFFLIFVLSMMNEDTLETHAGISYIAFFYGLFLFYKPENEN